MGEEIMIRKLSLRKQFVVTFVLILIISVICTMVTYFGGFILYQKITYKRTYPANYYEKQIPTIEEYLYKVGEVVLDKEEKNSLEKIIPVDGIVYEVMDEDGDIIYGTENKKLIKNKKELYKSINTTFKRDEKYIKLIPIINNHGSIVGGVSLAYSLNASYNSTLDKIWIVPLFFIIIFSPFIYIILFTIVFTRKLSLSINKPLKILMNASKKIKEKDLDFQIDYHAQNELGSLCEAFSEMKDELKQSLLAQWKLEQERQEMVEALAHDLKTPLSIIQVYSESLMDENTLQNENVNKYLKVIKENASKSSDIVKEMVYASELENSDMLISTEPMNIEKFINSKSEDYSILCKNKSIEVIFETIDKRENKKDCLIDINKLERILDNIVTNCIVYTPQNGIIRIQVKTEIDYIEFLICDTGCGFNKEELSNVFNKFYRGDKSRTSKKGHAGLGLYIAKQLVEKHGGKIKAFNSENGGACINFTIKI